MNQSKQSKKNSNTSTSFWSKNWLPALVLLLLSMGIYVASIGFEYVLDDKIVVSENNYVQEGWSGIGKILSADTFKGYLGKDLDLLPGGRYRPLSLVTFAIEHAFFGLNPKVGHFNNILLYALSILLLFRVLAMLFPAQSHTNVLLTWSFVASLLFVLHPIHTEAIANIKGRDEILALLLALGALYASLKYIKSSQILWLIPTSLCFLLGVLAKENALSWLVIIPLAHHFFTNISKKQHYTVIGTLLGVSILYIFIRFQALGYLFDPGKPSQDIMNNPFVGLSFGEWSATVMYTLGQYLKLLLYPHPLTHDYYPYQVPILNWTDWRAILSLVLHLGLLIYAMLGLRSKKVLAFGILYYLITLFIVSNIPVNVGAAMNERFVYMPSLGFVIILAWLLTRWMPQQFKEKAGEINVLSVGLLLVFVMGYTWKTMKRVPDWKNPITLNAAAVKYSPNSARANCFMGVALYEEYKTMNNGPEKDKLLEDITYYINRSLTIYPAYSSALTMKGGIAAEHYRRDQDLTKLLQSFEQVLMYRTRMDFVDEYLDYLKSRAPSGQLAQFLVKIGYEFNLQQRRDNVSALHYLSLAYEIAPNNAEVNYALGRCYQDQGDQTRAQDFLEAAYRLNPALRQ